MLEDLQKILVAQEFLLSLCLILNTFDRVSLDPVLISRLYFLSLELCFDDVDQVLGSLLKKHVVITFPSLLDIPVGSQDSKFAIVRVS